MEPVGLQNIGNTCYMNSIIQLLMLCTSFTNIIKKINTSSDTVNELKKFINKYESSSSPIPPFEIKKIISSYKIFEGFDQHDAHEFLIYIIDMIDEDLKKEGYSSLSEEIFNYKFYTKIVNQEQKEEKILKFHETVLTLPLSPSLSDSYTVFCENETIENWESEKYKRKVTAVKKNVIYKWPKHLFVLFKKYNNNSQKIDSLVDVPLEWNIHNKYQGKEKIDQYLFSGCVIHFGNLFGGHYVSIVFKNDCFYFCNDCNISKMDSKQAIELIKRSYLVLYTKQ